MSIRAPFPSAGPGNPPALEVAERDRKRLDNLFASTRNTMIACGASKDRIAYEFLAQAMQALDELEEGPERLAATAHAMVAECVGSLYGNGDDPLGSDPVRDGLPGSKPVPPQASDGEACFVARLAADMAMSQARITGDLPVSGTNAVTQALGLLQEARRQLADVRAGRTTIRDAQPAATPEAA